MSVGETSWQLYSMYCTVIWASTVLLSPTCWSIPLPDCCDLSVCPARNPSLIGSNYEPFCSTTCLWLFLEQDDCVSTVGLRAPAVYGAYPFTSVKYKRCVQYCSVFTCQWGVNDGNKSVLVARAGHTRHLLRQSDTVWRLSNCRL